MGRAKKDNADKELKQLLANLQQNLPGLRKKKKLTQQELATHAGLAISTVNEIERGRADDVRLSTITALARLLNIDPFKLFKEPQKG